VAAADLVLTGESVYDWSSLRSDSAVSGVAQLAVASGVPCLVLAERVAVGRREMAAAGVEAAYAAHESAGPGLGELPTDPRRAREQLAALAERVARQWSPTRSRAPG
jgi:glycerate kinase